MGTYYYIVCHDCKVEQPAASTSCGNSPGHLVNSDTHLLPFIVEHAGHNTQCVSEHHDGANQDYAEYQVKPEWRERVVGVAAELGPGPTMAECAGKYLRPRLEATLDRVLQGGPIVEQEPALLVGRQQYDVLAKHLRWKRDPQLRPLQLPTPWLLPDGRPPGEKRQTPLAKNYTWAEPWHHRVDPWPWYIEPAATQANAPKECRHGQDH